MVGEELEADRRPRLSRGRGAGWGAQGGRAGRNPRPEGKGCPPHLALQELPSWKVLRAGT